MRGFGSLMGTAMTAARLFSIAAVHLPPPVVFVDAPKKRRRRRRDAPRSVTYRSRSRSRYMPHKGGGQRSRPWQMTEGDIRRLERAEAKRQRKGIF